MPNPKIIHSTTQDFLDIYDISNNIILLKGGSASMVMSVNAMNFGLLAEQEQDAIIYTYAALLNSLNYPIQILIQSQTKDASAYLELLKKQEEKASSQSKKDRIARYGSFVSQLIRERNVLDKKFYVVVSASALEMGLLPAQTVLPGAKNPDVSTIEKTLFLERAQTILEPRRDHLLGQFGRIGLFARQIPTQEIIQIFYNNYNPEAAEGQQITDSDNYTTPMVKATINENYMNTLSQPASPSQSTQNNNQQFSTQQQAFSQNSPIPDLTSVTPEITQSSQTPNSPQFTEYSQAPQPSSPPPSAQQFFTQQVFSPNNPAIPQTDQTTPNITESIQPITPSGLDQDLTNQQSQSLVSPTPATQENNSSNVTTTPPQPNQTIGLVEEIAPLESTTIDLSTEASVQNPNQNSGLVETPPSLIPTPSSPVPTPPPTPSSSNLQTDQTQPISVESSNTTNQLEKEGQSPDILPTTNQTIPEEAGLQNSINTALKEILPNEEIAPLQNLVQTTPQNNIQIPSQEQVVISESPSTINTPPQTNTTLPPLPEI